MQECREAKEFSKFGENSVLLKANKVILKSIADSRFLKIKKSNRELWQKGMPFSLPKKP